jgi:hypothetical protein
LIASAASKTRRSSAAKAPTAPEPKVRASIANWMSSSESSAAMRSAKARSIIAWRRRRASHWRRCSSSETTRKVPAAISASMSESQLTGVGEG